MRGRITNKKTGPKNPRSTVLIPSEEQVICEFRRLTKFSLDDVFISLKKEIPALTRSNLHRCLKRHNLSPLPLENSNKTGANKKQKFKNYAIGYVHIDITEMRVEKQKLYLFVGIERVCKCAYVELHERMTQKIACSFSEEFYQRLPV